MSQVLDLDSHGTIVTNMPVCLLATGTPALHVSTFVGLATGLSWRVTS